MATLKQVKNEIAKELDALGETDKVLRAMANEAFRLSAVRIFEDGIKSDSTPIGTYKSSTRAFRKRVNKDTGSRIILELTSQFKRAYNFDRRSDKEYVLGFAETNRVTINSKPSDTTNKEIIDFNEDRFGNIFALTSEEDFALDQIADDFVNGRL